MVSLSSRVAPLLALVTLNLCPPICFAQGPGAAAAVASDWPVSFARCHPVPLRNVETRGFLGDRVTRNGASVLRGVETPLPRGFEARAAGAEPGPETRRLAADSDLYKWMEGAAYMLAITGDKEIEHQLERIGALVIKNQKPDGYINTQVPPALRFDPKINHDLYTAGHFFEAAVAHYRATGRSTLLNAARRWADYLIKEYESGNPYFQTIAQREHSEYELGFLRLYRATGDERYLNLASKLTRLIPAGPELFSGQYAGRSHAVRVNYLLAAYADLALETGRAEWKQNLEDVWTDIVQNRSFITGGVSVSERYPAPHVLPQAIDNPDRDIAETCTSISLMMFAWRMHSLTGQSKYFDQIETTLYNHFLSGPSFDQMATFYYNPLKLTEDMKGKKDNGTPASRRTRMPAIHKTACCLPNEWRFFGALGEYIYSFDDKGLFVNLYTSGKVRQKLAGGSEAALSVETNYPHDGRIVLRIEGKQPAHYALRLRVPKWATGAAVQTGSAKPKPATPGEYTVLDRNWKPGDTVVLNLPMQPRMILPDPREKDNAGQAVLARGPLVYCMEQNDVAFPIQEARWALQPEEAPRKVKPEWQPSLLGGIHVLKAPGTVGGQTRELVLIPYYAHANRAEDTWWITFLPLPASGSRPPGSAALASR